MIIEIIFFCIKKKLFYYQQLQNIQKLSLLSTGKETT